MKRYARYAPFRFKPALGLAAAALTAATMALAVGVPAALSESAAGPEPAATRAAARAIEVTIIPASIEVVGLRDESVARVVKTRASVRG